MSSIRWRIRFRSGISVAGEVSCDDAASVAKRTKPDSQSGGVAVFVRLKRTVHSRHYVSEKNPILLMRMIVSCSA